MAGKNPRCRSTGGKAAVVAAVLLPLLAPAFAQDAKISKADMQIDALDPGIKLFLREKMAEGNSMFNDDNIIPAWRD
jgi:hypothetical protein